MRVFALAVAVLLCTAAVVVVRGDDEVDDPDTIVLTNDNFDAMVNSEELILVEFYAPWCGHCKRLAPEYAKAATRLKANKPPIKLAKLDATAHSEAAGRFSVSGYPTLKVFRDGKPSDYQGPRDADGIVNYMRKQVGPAAKPVDTAAELDSYLKGEGNFWVVGFFSSGAPSALQSSFLLTASKMRDDFIFIKTTNEALKTKYEVQGEAIVAFKTFDDLRTSYTGKSTTKLVEEWIMAQSLPTVGEWNAQTAEQYQKKDLPILKLYVPRVDFKGSNVKHTQYYVNRLKAVATEMKGKMLFALADSDKNKHEMESLQINDKKEPVVIQDGDSKYVMSDKFSADAVKKFVGSFENGDAEKFVKSEEPPADNSGPVKVVTGKTFEQIVSDPEKDVMIEFYAPWCGHCKSLEPKYKELGKKFKKDKNVVIAKLDATANDYPSEYQVSGYPTIYFKPAGSDSSLKKYEGDREVAAMADFIKKNAKSGKKKKQ